MPFEETARYLKKGKITLYKTAREGKIPTEVTMFIILKDFVCSSRGCTKCGYNHVRRNG